MHCDGQTNETQYMFCHVKWINVTMAQRVLRLWMEEMASRYGG